ALLRCLGASRTRTLRLFLLQLLGLGIIATLLGLASGWLMQAGLVYLLRELLPPDLPGAGLRPLLVGAATGMVSLFCFALPPLLRPGRVSLLRALRRELTPLRGGDWSIYGLALSALCLLVCQLSDNLPMTLAVITGGAIAALLLVIPGWLLLCDSGD